MSDASKERKKEIENKCGLLNRLVTGTSFIGDAAYKISEA